MDKSYRFLFDTEPTDEQLAELMRAVATEVKERAKLADQKYRALMQQQLKQTLEKWKSIQKKHENNKA
ncbi:MAG TPA: hypothetical protein PK239_02985 [Chitinophagales bacterium]|nr:hypothetical protein [Chitinophagales bacterium]HRK26234.1 hypothetical protein [Chitinophagales bacterium]